MKFQDLKQINAPYAGELKEVAAEVIDSGWYLQGQRVAIFEEQLCNYLGCPYTVSVGNGLDALRLIFRAYIEMGVMQSGDEVIVPANTFIASVLAITDNQLVPVFAEPDEQTFNLDIENVEERITARTRAIVVVHLYGRCCWNERLKQLAAKYDLKIIEDNAQAIGAVSRIEGFNGTYKTGTLGDAAAISFYPAKNLGALGDAGAITTNDPELVKVVRALANYGSAKKYVSIYQGLNSRMDELQAAFLSVKLKYLDQENQLRRQVVQWYNEQLSHLDIIKPQIEYPEGHVWHQYVIRTTRREELQSYLEKHGIPTMIHYPVPPHKQTCYTQYNDFDLPITTALSREILSLPISPVITESDILEISSYINNFFMKK
ncbi:DegT/DnrJ/EryC1/StrS family aminotransferase [Coprobacter sp.]